MNLKCYRALGSHFYRRGGFPPLRQMSSYSFSSQHAMDDETWPLMARNTVLNVCPQGEKMVVERLGKFKRVQEPGWFLAIPLVDRIAYRVDTREKAVKIPPQSAITHDNVSVEVSGNIYTQFRDATKAAYGSTNPLYAIKQHAQSSMRAAIGELELDEVAAALFDLLLILASISPSQC